jgi:hypothetical protein
MGQHHDPDDLDHQDLDDGLGRPVYHGDGLSVRELSAEELQRFLDAHTGQPAQLLGSGWAAWTLQGIPRGCPGPLRLGPRRRPPSQSPAATVAPAARPWSSTGGGVRSSWPRGPAVWPGGHRWSAPQGSPATCLLPWPACRGPGWPAWLPPCWLAGGCGFAPQIKRARGSAAAKASATPPGCWTALPATAMWSSTTWPSPARMRTWITW